MNSNMLPRDRYNAKQRAVYERRKAKHLPVIKEMAKTSTLKEIAESTKTTISFVSRVIKEENLRG